VLCAGEEGGRTLEVGEREIELLETEIEGAVTLGLHTTGTMRALVRWAALGWG
jgi:hypothetical protein